ncbi:hypothetical protein PTKIN_Ptkin01aG0365300 [Pterospermum kingtungense]
MEFPHNYSHTHHRRDDEEEERPPHLHHQHHGYAPPPPPQQYYQQPGFDGPSPPPPPSAYYQQPPAGFAAPPPPYQQPSHVTHVHHSGGGYQPEPGSFNYSPAPAYGTHPSEGHHSYTPPMPSSAVHHQSHTGPLSELSNKPTVKVFCKANPNFHLTIRDGKVVLAPADPSDEFQHWYKDEKFSTRVKDEVGFPSFSLVNKATGEAIKHSIGASHPVQLIPYRPDHLDESILWSQSTEVRDGYRALRMINNIRLNLDAFHDGHKSVVHDGTIIGLWQWKSGENQQWKIVPY